MEEILMVYLFPGFICLICTFVFAFSTKDLDGVLDNSRILRYINYWVITLTVLGFTLLVKIELVLTQIQLLK